MGSGVGTSPGSGTASPHTTGEPEHPTPVYFASKRFNRHVRECGKCSPPMDLCRVGHELDVLVSDLAAAAINAGLR